eukprot:178223_1
MNNPSQRANASMASSTPTESSVEYSAEEITEMQNIFNKYDKDGSGHLNAHEFTNALQLMDYKYNETFVTHVLQLVFEERWQSKQNNLVFDDFLDFMSEFEPVHYQVLDKIEDKLQQKNINHIAINDIRITNLLKYAQMHNGTLLFNQIDAHLDELRTPIDPPKPHTETLQNAENSELKPNVMQPQIAPNPMEMKYEESDNQYLLKMNNDQLIEWINADKAFNTTLIRKECCNIIQSQQWNANDLMQALTLDKLDEILLLFHGIEYYEYIIQSINSFNSSDVNGKELMQHLEMIQKQIIAPTIPRQLSESLDVQDAAPPPAPLTIHAEIQPPPSLRNIARTVSLASKAIMDGDDEQYIQTVWKQILQFFDADNDGTIDRKEMAPALRSLGIDVNDDKLNDMIMKMDQDKSGTIDYSEFKTYYNSLFADKIKQGLDWKYIQNIFETYDTNASGFLDIHEFAYALKKLCAHITQNDIKSIVRLIDSSGDEQIEFDEFVAFLESQHPKAEWVLKKLIRASIPTPMEYLVAFRGLPEHFRTSQLAEIAKHNSFRMSEWLRPKVDVDGVTLQNIAMDPRTGGIKRKYHTNAMENGDDHKENEDTYLQNMRIFKLTECCGVALPAPEIASQIVSRRVRVCLFANNEAISNVFTIPALWKPTEQDQWVFGSQIWKDSMSSTVSEWNTFCVSIPQNMNQKLELFIELCVTTKQSATEMSCGWSKLELLQVHNTNGGINRTHKLRICGGTFNNKSNINESDVRNDRASSLSFRKLKQALTSIESVIKFQEQSYQSIKSSKSKECMKWIPQNMITNVSSANVIYLYYELMADCWFRNKQIFEFQFFKQNLYQTLLLFIVDRP